MPLKYHISTPFLHLDYPCFVSLWCLCAVLIVRVCFYSHLLHHHRQHHHYHYHHNFSHFTPHLYLHPSPSLIINTDNTILIIIIIIMTTIFATVLVLCFINPFRFGRMIPSPRMIEVVACPRMIEVACVLSRPV